MSIGPPHVPGAYKQASKGVCRFEVAHLATRAAGARGHALAGGAEGPPPLRPPDRRRAPPPDHPLPHPPRPRGRPGHGGREPNGRLRGVLGCHGAICFGDGRGVWSFFLVSTLIRLRSNVTPSCNSLTDSDSPLICLPSIPLHSQPAPRALSPPEGHPTNHHTPLAPRPIFFACSPRRCDDPPIAVTPVGRIGVHTG